VSRRPEPDLLKTADATARAAGQVEQQLEQQGEQRDEEGALLQAARTGDRDAFDRLAVRLLPRLLGTARRLLHDPVEAEEAVAATLVRAHAALGGFRGASALSTWAHRILCRIATDRLRQVARMRRRERPLPDTLLSRACDGPDAGASAGEQRARVRAAVEALPETQRLVLVLVAWEGLPLSEAARVLDMRYATVKSNLHHARGTLRRVLGLDEEPA
jgi:RNA polymerase sigma-70 factor (ECF subfamily)